MTPKDYKRPPESYQFDADVIVIGAGSAGCYTALNLAPLKVAMISPQNLGGESSSLWAQGGIAAAVAKDDTPDLHIRDTLKAAAGTADIDAVRRVTEAAPDIIKDLNLLNVQFDRAEDGSYTLNREACHSTRRVLKAKAGDGFGRALMSTLIENVKQSPHVNVMFPYTAERLSMDADQNINGVYIKHIETGEITLYRAKAVVLATGGLGGLYDTTTNPLSSVGRGVALAAEVGAVLSDLEFVQFHPTALDIGLDPAPLATEALRGDGARLVNDLGEYFMDDDHPMKDLAPRDIVSRSIFKQLQKGRTVYLDCTDIETEKFPALCTACEKVGIDPQKTPVPVRPATHYHMGGIDTDEHGRTSIVGLWAVGEVGATGLHGANRLASNSLMEALVMGQRAGRDIVSIFSRLKADTVPAVEQPTVMRFNPELRQVYIKHLRQTMSTCVGVARDESDLKEAIDVFQDVMDETQDIDLDIYDRALVGYLIASDALKRTESRGGHYRIDYPQSEKSWKHRSYRVYKHTHTTKPFIYEVAE